MRFNRYPIVIIIDVIYMIDVILSFFTGTIDTTVNPPKVGLNNIFVIFL